VPPHHEPEKSWFWQRQSHHGETKLPSQIAPVFW
jgi:hypothetical protein